MKATKLLLCSMLFLWANIALSQRAEQRQRKAEEKSEISKTSDQVKQTSAETKEAVSTAKETLDDAKSLATDIGSIFKSKKSKTKRLVTISLGNVAYGNASLNALQKALKTVRNAKNVTKKYQNNTATFSMEYKKDADQIWQSLPTDVTEKFKIISVEENSISISLNSEKK